MNQTPPLQKNDDIELTIDTLTLEGQGVGRKDGFAVFVPGALPGEEVSAHVIKVSPAYAVAKLMNVITPSPDRVEPRCPVYALCGGCAFQHMDYAAELRFKEQAVADALMRLGGFSSVPLRPIIGMEHPWRYRNKGSFPIGHMGNTVVAGFYAERSHRLIPVTDCPIQTEKAMDVVRRVTEWANTYSVSAYDELTHRGVLKHVMARTSVDGQTMAVIVTTTERLKHSEALISLLADVDSVYQNVNPDDTNVIFGKTFKLLSGVPAITETVGKLSFTVSPQSFLQVNPAQTERLYGAAVDLLKPAESETIVDAYCGIGTISLLVAKRAGRVIGVESVAEAIEDAKQNAAQNGIENASFLCGDAAAELEALRKRESIAALVADPPRKGMDERMVTAILEANIPRLVYVSCNPATLARDSKLLAAGGYTLSAVQSVDMFPRTGHVETCVLLSHKNS